MMKSGCTEWLCVTNDASSTKIICIFVELEAKETIVEKQTDSQDKKLQVLKELDAILFV